VSLNPLAREALAHAYIRMDAKDLNKQHNTINAPTMRTFNYQSLVIHFNIFFFKCFGMQCNTVGSEIM
jgi:hypothetical protein